MYVEFKLPKPSDQLLQLALETRGNVPIDMEVKELVDTVMDGNGAACIYHQTPEITELAKQQYSEYFDEPFEFAVINLKNLDPSRLAYYPPHTDMLRNTTLNYVIDPGGKDVVTVAYTDSTPYDDPAGYMTNYSSKTVERIYKLNEQRWYGVDVKKYHSVERIEHDRFMLSLSFIKTTLDELKAKYPDLITPIG